MSYKSIIHGCCLVSQKPSNISKELIVKYISDGNTPTLLYNYDTEGDEEEWWKTADLLFDKVEIDGVEVSIADLDNAQGMLLLSEGEHTVKYTLKDPTSIGDYVFRDCTGLTSITIPNSVTSIGRSAFWNCTSLTSIDIPSSVTSIGGYAFAYCSSLTSITISDGVTSIGDEAFSWCSGLISVTIPDSVTSIEGYLFWNCSSLTSVTIPNSVTSIGGSAFSDCTSLTSVNIPSGVTSIGDYAFTNCTSLTSVTIDKGVTSIGKAAFRNCTGLTSIICNATTAPTITDNTFRNVKTNGTLTVPSGSSGYDVWMGLDNYYLGKYLWTKVEQ